MWSSTEIIVYRRFARRGSGRKVTERSSPVLAVVKPRLAASSSIDFMSGLISFS